MLVRVAAVVAAWRWAVSALIQLVGAWPRRSSWRASATAVVCCRALRFDLCGARLLTAVADERIAEREQRGRRSDGQQRRLAEGHGDEASAGSALLVRVEAAGDRRSAEGAAPDILGEADRGRELVRLASEPWRAGEHRRSVVSEALVERRRAASSRLGHARKDALGVSVADGPHADNVTIGRETRSAAALPARDEGATIAAVTAPTIASNPTPFATRTGAAASWSCMQPPVMLVVMDLEARHLCPPYARRRKLLPAGCIPCRRGFIISQYGKVPVVTLVANLCIPRARRELRHR
ncbi:hypothetical protein LHA26_03340 [Sphingomonas morindae]|uniref:Secreted protein n=1 Tax=Sphingomonas morindae TaxID=1541170 RepID=A0ABY4X9B2_9SPHN|nr:hypothetical protein [Sphingomonas morindae]USI73529.1 hypothetical protein LHA26_03340 [Sphingomonas morindae]